MPILDYFIFVFGTIGIAHFLVNAEELKSFLYNKFVDINYRNKNLNIFILILYRFFTLKPFYCWPCATFWSSALTVNFYFVNEILLTKVLICFTNYLLVWFVLMLRGEE